MNISEMTRDRAIVTIKRQLEVIYTLSHGDTAYWKHCNKPTLGFCRQDALPVTQPTVSEHWREIYSCFYFAM